MGRQPGLFDTDERLQALSAAGDPLERLRAVVDFELFRADLEATLDRSDRSRGGRPPYDAVLMFRVLVLQTLYTLSDDQTEYQLRDRLSFMRFADLALHDPVPDAKTIWLFREQLMRSGALAKLFERFDAPLRARGNLAMGGQVVDATGIEARKPRLSKNEKATLRQGRTLAHWSKARTRQIDRDGRWTLKRGKKQSPPESAQRQSAEIAVPVFGYKNHVGIDRTHGFIRRFTVIHAARHDGSQLAGVLDAANTASDVWADAREPGLQSLPICLDHRASRARLTPNPLIWPRLGFEPGLPTQSPILNPGQSAAASVRPRHKTNSSRCPELPFHLISRLYEQISVIVTANLAFGEGPSVLAVPKLAQPCSSV